MLYQKLLLIHMKEKEKIKVPACRIHSLKSASGDKLEDKGVVFEWCFCGLKEDGSISWQLDMFCCMKKQNIYIYLYIYRERDVFQMWNYELFWTFCSPCLTMSYGLYAETCQKNKMRLPYNQTKSLTIVEATIHSEEICCCAFVHGGNENPASTFIIEHFKFASYSGK